MGTEMDVESLYNFEQRFKDLAECANTLTIMPSSPMGRTRLDEGFIHRITGYDFYVEGEGELTKPPLLEIDNGMIRVD